MLFNNSSARTSLLVLIIANTIPLFGVVFFDWSLFNVILIYWVENVVVWLFNIFRMIKVRGSKIDSRLVRFFTVHFGLFTFVHGKVVMQIFGENESVDVFSLALGFFALLVSHGYSFFANFIHGGEYKKVSVDKLFWRPYGRIFVLHLSIFALAYAVQEIQTPLYGLVFFVLAKMVVDGWGHVREHARKNLN